MTVLMLSCAAAQETTLEPLRQGSIDPLLSTAPVTENQAPPKVTSVYGITADDYLPSVKELARKHLRPQMDFESSRPRFDLPDAFYYIGGPIFLILFLQVIVIFLNIFDEMRKEEQRKAASKSHKLEQT